jgi:hypothetical protein
MWGLPATSSLIRSSPTMSPVVLGVIVTLIVQLAPAANMLGPSWQVLVWAKSPLMVMLLMVSGASPLFAR